MTPDDDSMWMIRGLCRQIGGDAWFPDSLEMDVQTAANEAKRTCRECPVQQRCLEWALRAGEEFGIWGGVNFSAIRAKGRRKLCAEYGIEPAARHGVHGTEAGYQRHMRRNEEPCLACVDAGRIARRLRREQQQNGAAS